MDLLSGTDTAFVLVASTDRHSLDEALYFHRRLGESGIEVRAMVVNRTHSMGPIPPGKVTESPFDAGFSRSDGDGRDALVESMWMSYRSSLRQREVNERSINELHRHCGAGLPLARIPRLEGEVHDLRALSKVALLLSRS